MVFLVLAAVLPASILSVSAREKLFPAIVHLRHPDGLEEIVNVSDLRFVYYDRRFVRHPTGFGKPGDLDIRDLPREVHSIQDEELARLRFAKIRKVVFMYREEGGKRLLRLVVTRSSRRRKPADWPGGYLRNANTARLPHFRGHVSDRIIDFPLPPFAEPASFTEPVLTQIDIQPPVWGPRR
jgi:hypothetical protein